MNRWGNVHSDRGAVSMFISEFRPTQGCSWRVTLYNTITLPESWRDQYGGLKYACNMPGRNQYSEKYVYFSFIKLWRICWHDISNSSMMEYTGKIAHFSHGYEKVNKTDCIRLHLATCYNNTQHKCLNASTNQCWTIYVPSSYVFRYVAILSPQN